MAVLVGSGYSTYELRIDALRRNVAEAKQLLTQLDRDATALTRVRPVRLVDGAAAASGARSVRQLAGEADRALREFERLERQVRRTTDAEIASARATGNYDRALTLLNSELNAATRNSERYFQIQSRIAQVQRQQAAAGGGAALPRTFAGFPDAAGALSFAGGIAGGIGIAGAVSGVASAGAQASRQALDFRRAEQDLRILAGTQQRYNLLLSQARENQILFGGAITDNLDPLQQLIFISNRTGASLEQLNETARLLGATNTREGIQGAGFSIGEFLSGDTTSIVERFNLPRQAINDLKNAEIDTAEKLRLLNALILEQGDVAAVLEQRLKGPEAQFRRLEQAQERIIISGGNVINSILGVGAAAANSTGVLDRGAVAAEAYAAAIERGASVSQANIAFAQAFVAGQQQATGATEDATQATEQQAEAQQQQRNTLVENISAQQQAAVAAANQEKIQRDLEAAALRVATGQSTQAAEAIRLAQTYPELAGQAGPLITAQLEVKGTIEDVNAALREQRRLAQLANTVDLTGPVGIDAPGRRGNTLADFDAEIERRKELEAATRRQTLALEDSAERVARLRGELNAITDRDTAAYIDKQTELIEAEQRLASEREAAAKRGTTATTRATNDNARELERQIRDQEEAFRRLSRLQEDYNLSQSRDQEDFQRQRRRLLAEGRIFEAQQLAEEFGISQRRAQEDFAIRQARERGDAGITAGAAIVQTTAAAAQFTGGRAQTAGIAPLSATGAPMLRIEFAPIQLVADGRVLAEVAYPAIEERLTADLAVIQVAAPPGSSAPAAIGGPRP